MITNMVLTIDLDALAANYRAIRDQVAPAHVAGVVKADGYGLGSIPVVRTLLAQGCQHFFVAMLGEAEALMPVIDGAATLYVLNGLQPGFGETLDVHWPSGAQADQLKRSADALQQIIEVVGDARRQHSQ